jgi:hypothetical protein
MGIPIFKSCSTNSTIESAPNPNRYQIIEKLEFANAYVLRIKYFGCTNYEGMKIIVYKGAYKNMTVRDPHFSIGSESPIARFKPDAQGWGLAIDLAKGL